MTLGGSQRFSVSLNVYIVKLIWFITMSLHSFFALYANFENVDTPNTIGVSDKILTTVKQFRNCTNNRRMVKKKNLTTEARPDISYIGLP